MPSPESLMNTNQTFVPNNSLMINSMKDKPSNVTMNSNSELVKLKKLPPLFQKPMKPLLDVNNKELEPLKTYPLPKDKSKKKPLNYSTSTPPEDVKNILMIPPLVFITSSTQLSVKLLNS